MIWAPIWPPFGAMLAPSWPILSVYGATDPTRMPLSGGFESKTTLLEQKRTTTEHGTNTKKHEKTRKVDKQY